MKKLFLLLLTAALLLPWPAVAQFIPPGQRPQRVPAWIGCIFNTAIPTLSNLQPSLLQCDVNGRLQATLSSASPIAPATATATKSNLVGGQYNSTQATFTDGQQGSIQISSRGELKIINMDAAGNARGANVDASNRLSITLDNIAGSLTLGAITTVGTVTNLAQMNGAALLMGNGVTGTGSQRVTIASDNTAFSVNATLSAETTKVIGTINIAAAQTLATVTTVGTVTNLAQMNGVALLMGNGVTGTGSQRVTVASDNTPFPVKLDQTTPGTTNAVSIAQIGASTVVNGGLAGSLSIGGTVATNVAITDNPVNTGGQAVSSENAAVTTARKVQFVADLVGKQIVLPYANPENFVSGVITAAMTGTTTTSLIAAPAAGLRNYITQCTFSNSHATVGTDILIQDGSGGTTIYLAPAAPAFGGATITFPTPLRQPTTATAIFVANVTTGANTKVACSGYKGI